MKNVMIIFNSENKESFSKVTQLKNDFLQLLQQQSAFFKQDNENIVLNEYTFNFFDIDRRNIEKFMEKNKSIDQFFYIIGEVESKNINKINELTSEDNTSLSIGLQISEHDLFKIIDTNKVLKNVYIITHQNTQYSKLEIFDYRQNEQHFENEESVQNEIIKRSENRIQELQRKIDSEKKFIADFKNKHDIITWGFKF